MYLTKSSASAHGQLLVTPPSVVLRNVTRSQSAVTTSPAKSCCCDTVNIIIAYGHTIFVVANPLRIIFIIAVIMMLVLDVGFFEFSMTNLNYIIWRDEK